MRKLIVLILFLLASPLFAQSGELGLSWTPSQTLCSGAVDNTIGYYVHWSTSPQDPSLRPPAGYENMVTANSNSNHVLTGLLDCTDYYIAVSAQNSNNVWSAECTTAPNFSGGYSNEAVSWARQRLNPPDETQLRRGESYNLAITGANLRGGIFSDVAGLIWGTPVIIDCNNMMVTVDIPASAPLGPNDVVYARDDGVNVGISAYVNVLDIVSEDPPPPPTGLIRTQPVQ